MLTLKLSINACKGLKNKQELWHDLPTALLIDFTTIGLTINQIVIWIT